MKRFNKSQIDRLIECSRLYWKTGNLGVLDDKHDCAMEIERATLVDWLSLANFVDAITRPHGFLPDADNEKIYEVLSVLGWEVADEDKES